MSHVLQKVSLVVLSAFVMSLTFADEIAIKGKDILTQNKAAVIPVKIVVKSGMSYGGKDTNRSESSNEIIGTVIDPNGLTLVSLSATDPTSVFGNMFGMGEGEDSKVKFQSELTDVKLIQPDGKEIPAKVVLRDNDLDMAFIQPINKPDKPFPYIDLSKSAQPSILDQVVTINRMSKSANRTPQVSLDRVEAIIDKPRTFYVLGRSLGEGGLGTPIFNLDGKIIGILLLRSSKSDNAPGMGALLGGTGGLGIMPLVLPAADILDATKQVPAIGSKPAATDTKK